MDMADDEDFEEEEVWNAVAERRDQQQDVAGPNAAARRGKMAIPRSARGRQATAPVSIPDWSKIYRRHGGQGPSASSATVAASGRGEKCKDNENDDEDVDEEEQEEEDDDDERAPPHEWLAKKMARTQISSSSVCEGAGRTLKGRDLSKVRNAVLTKTGFLE